MFSSFIFGFSFTKEIRPILRYASPPVSLSDSLADRPSLVSFLLAMILNRNNTASQIPKETEQVFFDFIG